MRNPIRDIVMISLFAALTAVGAFIKIPIPNIPLTLQTLMVMFAGLILGSRRGALSQFLYLLIGLMGIPIFAQGGGPGYILQPSFGFLIGFIAMAFVIGKVVEGENYPSMSRTILGLLLGQAVMYLLGIAYLYFSMNFLIHKSVSLYTTIKIGLLIFIPGDFLKTLVAVLVAVPIRQRLLVILR